MGRWTKTFVDRSTYVGEDSDIDSGEASWRNSRLIGMTYASVDDGGQHIELGGFGEFWQSDMYEAKVDGNCFRIRRCIMRQVTLSDRCYDIRVENGGHQVHFSAALFPANTRKAIPSEWIGKWYVLELDLRTREISTYMRNSKT